MSSVKPLVLLLGAGANIGKAVVTKFVSSGFDVAAAARRLKDGQLSHGRWTFKIDLNRPNSVADLFSKAHYQIGIPNVVIYNDNCLTLDDDIAADICSHSCSSHISIGWEPALSVCC